MYDVKNGVEFMLMMMMTHNPRSLLIIKRGRAKGIIIISARSTLPATAHCRRSGSRAMAQYYLEGPETCTEGWGTLTCTGFTTEMRGEYDYDEVMLMCADAPTKSKHKGCKGGILGIKDVFSGQQFTLQWDTDQLIPGGNYKFLWERNGEEMASTGVVNFKQHNESDPPLTHPSTMEYASSEKIQLALRPPKKSMMRARYIVSCIVAIISSVVRSSPYLAATSTRVGFKMGIWAFRNWLGGRNMVCSKCQAALRPWGFFSGTKCSRNVRVMWLKSLIVVLATFWFASSGMRSSLPTATVSDKVVKSGDIVNLVGLVEDAFHRIVALGDIPTKAAAKGAPVEIDFLRASLNLTTAAWGLFRPAIWVLFTTFWVIYWVSGLLFPAILSFILDTVSVASISITCCKCTAAAATTPASVGRCRVCRDTKD